MNKVHKIYTDGGCIPNPGKGGWGWVSESGEFRSGRDLYASNNQMELQAMLDALSFHVERYLSEDPERRLIVFTDSKYVMNGVTSWVAMWKRTNWVTSTGSKVLNREYWEAIDQIYRGYKAQIMIKWVPGHLGLHHNELADALASNEVLGLIKPDWMYDPNDIVQGKIVPYAVRKSYKKAIQKIGLKRRPRAPRRYKITREPT